MEKFRKLGIIEPILKLIQEEGFEVPSEIQEKAIPLVLEGKDVIAGAATGSGKTLVFAAGIIKNCERGKGIQALVLTPTRELAEQVCQWIQRFSKNKHLEIASVYGGVAISPQIDKLRTADVVVGTPGRILDHMCRETINLSKVKILVLDEADRMLDMGFKDDVEKIISQCPLNRQTLLFSATISYEVTSIAERYMKNPVEVSAEAYVDPSKLKQVYYDAGNNQKFSLLAHLLKNEESELAMVFCNTQRNTDFVAKNLNMHGIKALAIHGGYSQSKRTNTMQRFHSQHISVLVCTDVAARGLDIKGVSHIYNYDIPKDSKDYIHRIGRTARAGEEGKVINILTQRDYDNFRRVIRDPELNITKEEIPDIERIFIKFDEGFNRRRFGRGESRGNRGNWFRGRYQERERRDNRGYGNRSRESSDRYPSSGSYSNRERFHSRGYGGAHGHGSPGHQVHRKEEISNRESRGQWGNRSRSYGGNRGRNRYSSSRFRRRY